MSKVRFLSGNALKMIAAIAMLIDHVGLLFFPGKDIFRIIGRLAFPIFAFMIAEGCRYTKNKLRHFLTLAAFALVIQLVYSIAMDSFLMSIFVTFSISVILIYSLQYFKKCFFDRECGAPKKLLSALLFVGLMFGAFVLNLYLDIDYGFEGSMIPVFASVLHSDENSPPLLKKLDILPLNLVLFGIGLLYMAAIGRPINYYTLISIPLLLLYSGKRGTKRLKYFFYIFYPLHLVVLYGLTLIIK